MSRSAVVDLLAALAPVLAERGWRWYVFGAQAAVAYGRPRMTADVDVTIDVDGAGAPALIDALAPCGIELRFALSAQHLAEARLLPMVYAPMAVPVDVVLAGAGIEQDFLARACVVELGGASVPLVSVEDLIAMKLLAGRRKDLSDVRGVLDEQGEKIDFARLRALLGELELASGERKLLARLERLVRASERARRAAPGRGPS